MKKYTQGFSLIELMVSLTISITFVAAAASLMTRNKTDYVPLRDSARMNEGAMAAFEVINRELEQAGFFGENESFQGIDFSGGAGGQPRFVNHMFNANSAVPISYNSLFGLKRTRGANGFLSTAVEGYDGAAPGSGFLPSGVTVFEDGVALATDIVPGTDAITIRGSFGGQVNITAAGVGGGAIGNRGPGVRLAQDLAAGAATIQLQNNTILPDQGYFVIFDGLNSELFKGSLLGNNLTIQDDTPNNNMPGNAFVNSFQSLLDGSLIAENGQAYVVEASFSRYYIGNFTRPDGVVVPSLYREFYDPVSNTVLRNSPAAGGGFDGQVLIEGVENMQITYAEDINGDGGADIYASANNVQNWSNVKAVKISLLLRSETPISIDATTATRTYQVNDQQYVPLNFNGGVQDRFMRKVYTTQIALDNGI